MLNLIIGFAIGMTVSRYAPTVALWLWMKYALALDWIKERAAQ